jgi:uncharacterized protein (PEP-CTERM system associated)
MNTNLNPLRSHRLIKSKLVASGLLVLTVMNVQAQGAGTAAGKPLVTIVPRVSLTETLTNNVELSNISPRSEQITEISPGIRLQIDSGRIKTYLDYALTETVYAQNTSPSNYSQALNAFGSVQAIENQVFIDFSGTISQQTISAFGVQSLDNTSLNANQTEVSTYRISPYLKGQLAGIADYEARLSRSITASDADTASGSANHSTVKLTSSNSFKGLGWSADLGRQRVSYSKGRTTESDTANIGPFYNINPQIQIYAKAGRETSNFTNEFKQNFNTSSIGVKWLPSTLSSLTLDRSHRSFGDVYNLSLQHRSGRTVWKFTDNKDISTTPSQTGISSKGSIYDLLFSQFASTQPDPVARAQMVDNYLLTNGLSATANADNSFLTSAISLQRRQELSFALLGVRDTITFAASRSETSRLDTISTGVDDLANAGQVYQQALSLQYAHRLTPDYALSLLFSRQKTSGKASLTDSNLRSVNVNVSGKLGKQSAISLGARRTIAAGDSSPYSESAVIGHIRVQF